jgi:glycosyltransferase involved in cell wall biosynthesis
VIIPVYNGQRYLAEAIKSVLAQTYRPLQTIVVDDGSTDDSALVAQSFGAAVELVHQEHSGAEAARNLGVQLARAPFLTFLDADDLWVEDKVARQMACLDVDPGLDLVSGYAAQFISPDLDPQLAKRIYCPAEPMPAPGPATMLIHRNAFLEVGLFEAKLQVGSTIQWYFRARERGLKELVLPDVLMKRRLHSQNQGVVLRNARVGYLRAVRQALERRRNSPNPDRGPTETGATKRANKG